MVDECAGQGLHGSGDENVLYVPNGQAAIKINGSRTLVKPSDVNELKIGIVGSSKAKWSKLLI